MDSDSGPTITLAHGNGGALMHRLIAEVLAPALHLPPGDRDAAPLGPAPPDPGPPDAGPPDTGASDTGRPDTGRSDTGSLSRVTGEPATPGLSAEGLTAEGLTAAAAMMIATDGVTVQPLVFPGGDLGRLAAHGTVNDLSVAGAVPHWLTLGLILEEGLPVATLRRLVTSFGQAVEAAGARVLAGDTKVVPRGQGGGVYATVTGLGPLVRPGLGVAAIRPGDAVLVSGPVGDHGTAVMLAREDFQISGDLVSDCASVAGLCRTAWRLDGLRFLRDPTRGGLATTGHEIVRDRGLGLTLDAATIPIRPAVASVCAMLGLDPLYLACEGRVVAVIAADQADALLADWRGRGDGAQAARIGTVTGGPARLSLTTPIGGTRLLEPLEDDPLPRIC